MKNQINSLKGWTAAATETNRESFITIFGRQPEPGEVESWVNELRESAEADVDRSFTDVLVKVGEQWRADRYFSSACTERGNRYE
ncbi:hypothetical protein [uncultured Trichococcus sp.]|uniref:hypothetical protein n=1 Tax=uncultured Trichococcus sp. TaxID=189665 RepID=UPI002A18C27C|nr:hypothetical protein [uncultured Trichococcus sp.]